VFSRGGVQLTRSVGTAIKERHGEGIINKHEADTKNGLVNQFLTWKSPDREEISIFDGAKREQRGLGEDRLKDDLYEPLPSLL